MDEPERERRRRRLAELPERILALRHGDPTVHAGTMLYAVSDASLDDVLVEMVVGLSAERERLLAECTRLKERERPYLIVEKPHA